MTSTFREAISLPPYTAEMVAAAELLPSASSFAVITATFVPLPDTAATFPLLDLYVIALTMSALDGDAVVLLTVNVDLPSSPGKRTRLEGSKEPVTLLSSGSFGSSPGSSGEVAFAVTVTVSSTPNMVTVTVYWDLVSSAAVVPVMVRLVYLSPLKVFLRLLSLANKPLLLTEIFALLRASSGPEALDADAQEVQPALLEDAGAAAVMVPVMV